MASKEILPAVRCYHQKPGSGSDRQVIMICLGRARLPGTPAMITLVPGGGGPGGGGPGGADAYTGQSSCDSGTPTERP